MENEELVNVNSVKPTEKTHFNTILLNIEK